MFLINYLIYESQFLFPFIRQTDTIFKMLAKVCFNYFFSMCVNIIRIFKIFHFVLVDIDIIFDFTFCYCGKNNLNFRNIV